MSDRIVKVTWSDSYGCPQGWGMREDIGDTGELLCVSFGLLIAESDTHIVVAPHYAPETTHTDEQVAGVMRIPRCCVQSIEDMRIEDNQESVCDT